MHAVKVVVRNLAGRIVAYLFYNRHSQPRGIYFVSPALKAFKNLFRGQAGRIACIRNYKAGIVHADFEYSILLILFYGIAQ
jgi:hypothetical protein